MMTRTISLQLPAALAALTLVAAPGLAQQRDPGRNRTEANEGRGNRPSEGRATERAQAPREAPRVESREAPRAESRVAPRNEVGVAPRVEPRRSEIAPRSYGPHYAPRYVPGYSTLYAPRYAPYWTLPGYYRPYVYRPRFSIGFGIFAGYPVPYTYAYPYAYSVGRPPASYYGGLVLEIEPHDAQVYVDGGYAGIAGDFDGSRQPLTLTAGRHRIEVQEPGLAPLVFDVTVQPGQVIPYRGDLRPY